MLTTAMDTIREQNARFARDVEYLKEGAKDDLIDDRTEIAEEKFHPETVEELQEAAEFAKKFTADDQLVQEKTEVERILAADHDLTFDEMIGIE